jgi:hypothetical protein
VTSEAAEPTRRPDPLRRPLVAALVVLAVYAVLAVLNSTGGYLGTDTGAKVATVEEMAEGGTASPAVGYWAEEWDPDGTYHPLLDTVQNEDGEWINVTTLPMLVAAWPLYDLGGYRLALLWPMLGAVAAAFACRDVARQVDGDDAGWVAFWVTALASPMVIYALDLWEHSLGAALMVWAYAFLLRTVRGSRSWWPPIVAGLLLGASASIRTETFVAAFVFVAASCLFVAWRRRWSMAVAAGFLSVGGFAVTWTLNSLLEAALGGNRRADRAAGVASSDWWSELSVRIEEAAVTWFALPGGGYPINALVGAVAVGALLVAGRAVQRNDERAARVAVAVLAAVYVASLAGGLAFVPGALVATPVAALVVLLPRWDAVRAHVAVVAVVTTVLIWLFQYTGGAGPQWAGRYILAPTLLLLSLGAVTLRRSRPLLRSITLATSVLVTAFGCAWLWHRSHDVDRFFGELAERPEEVVVSTNGFLVREAGSAWDERRYLSVGRRGDLDGAVAVVERSGASDFGVLTAAGRPPAGAGRLVESTELRFLGVPLYLHSFVLDE